MAKGRLGISLSQEALAELRRRAEAAGVTRQKLIEIWLTNDWSEEVRAEQEYQDRSRSFVLTDKPTPTTARFAGDMQADTKPQTKRPTKPDYVLHVGERPTKPCPIHSPKWCDLDCRHRQ